MLKYENHCCQCATPAFPCIGHLCPFVKVAVHYCDKCEEEIDEIYDVDDEELCEECLKDKFRRKE